MPGWDAASGVELNAGQVAFLDALASRVHARDPNIRLHVTSGTRTVGEQARALLTKLELGDDLTKLYKRGNGPVIVAAVLAAEPTVAGISAVLSSFAARGIYLSRHMRGDALDLGTTGGSMTGHTLSSTQISIVEEEAKALGARTLRETTPPHLHIENIGGGGGTVAAAADAARGALQRSIGAERLGGVLVAWRRWGRWAVLSVGIALGLWLAAGWWRRRRRARSA